MFEHLHGCVWERGGSEREYFQCMGSSSRQAREWVTNEDSLRPPSPNSQKVRGLYRDAASCPPFNHGPPPTPLTESLRYRCAGRRWWGWGELACCPSCRIARRYWRHKTHSIAAVWLLKSLRKKKQKKKIQLKFSPRVWSRPGFQSLKGTFTENVSAGSIFIKKKKTHTKNT